MTFLSRQPIRPTAAMILAAGLGTRMRPLTEITPKPLLRLCGRTLLDHAFDRLVAAGVQDVIVNAHWKAGQVETALETRRAASLPPRTTLLLEEALLETGGSVLAALPLLGTQPFYVVNGDAYWLDGPRTALSRLAAAFDPAEMDGVLLVHRGFQVRAEVGFGDFSVDAWGRPRRRGERQIVPYVYAGVQLVAPALLDAAPEAPFSMNVAWDSAIASGRLRVVVHDGLWFHLSTPEDLRDAEHSLRVPVGGAAQ